MMTDPVHSREAPLLAATTEPRAIVARFAIPAPIDGVEPYGRGLINDSFLVTTPEARYLLQRINARVFPDPARIMANLVVLDRHARARPNRDLLVPRLVPSQDGAASVRDAEGALWRLMHFIEDSLTLAHIEHPGQAREVGALLGRFHDLTRAIPIGDCGIALPGFHDTPAYLARLEQALAGPRDSDTELDACVAFALERRALARRLSDAVQAGQLPTRITHGDPKLDNILFDRATGRARALIDLDTLQPGLLIVDVGDCLRSCCNRGGETAEGEIQACFDLAVAAPLLAAYAEQTRDWLTAGEVALLGEAIRLLPYELGLRFLTDHLEGDRYFKVIERGENLRKARVQFDLVRDIERQAEPIAELIADSFGPRAHS